MAVSVVFSSISWTPNIPQEQEIKIIEITKAQEVVLNSDNLIKSELKITGMTCAIGCAATIEKKLNKTPSLLVLIT